MKKYLIDNKTPHYFECSDSIALADGIYTLAIAFDYEKHQIEYACAGLYDKHNHYTPLSHFSYLEQQQIIKSIVRRTENHIAFYGQEFGEYYENVVKPFNAHVNDSKLRSDRIAPNSK